MHRSVARLLAELQAAGAEIHTGEHYVTAGLRGSNAVYFRKNWASLAVPTVTAEQVLARGYGELEKSGGTTWYLRYRGDVLDNPGAFAEARGLALDRMGLTQTPVDTPDDATTPPADLAAARAIYEDLARYPAFNLEFVNGPQWTWARVGMGPFPARLVLDPEGARVDVVLGYTNQTAHIEDLLATIPMPPPALRFELGPQSLVTITYRAPLDKLTQDEAVGLLAASALYSNALAAKLFHDFHEVTREALEKAGLRPETGFDWPRETFLPETPVRFSPWEPQESPRLSDEDRLALSVARCPQVPLARVDPTHACHTIVTLQPEDPATWQVPEPWAGNLTGGRVIFISSNPSINEAEEYPRGAWPDEKIADFVTHRFSHGWVSPDDRVLLRDGTYHPDRVQYWLRIRQRAEELLGRPADPAVDYAMTEVVHCKSRRERGVARASTLCVSLHLDRIIATSPAPLVVVVGSKARDELRPLWDLPEVFGTREALGVNEWANLVPRALGGGDRVIAYLPHPTGMEPTREFADVYPTLIPGLQLLARGQITPNNFMDRAW